MWDNLSLDDVRNTATAVVVGVASLFVGTAPAPNAVTAPTSALTAKDVGQYAAVSWQDPSIPIDPGSYWDRVRDLNFAVAKEKLTDNMASTLLDQWAATAIQGAQQQKKLLLSVNFWNGNERVSGTMLPTAVYWSRIKKFLDGMKARNALQDYYGIVLAEENVYYNGRQDVLRSLYTLIKQNYNIQVFQWWSPSEAVPESGGWIPADGWVIDSYLQGNPTYRQYVRKYVLSGKPVVVMPWASSDSAVRPPLTTAQWQANNDQLNVAMEFNLPVAFYWTLNGTCYFDGDRNAPTNDEIGKMDQWVWDYIKKTQALPANYAGQSTADTYAAGALSFTSFAGSPGTVLYTDDFSTEKCVDHAAMTGFRDLVMDGVTLSARGFQGRNVSTSMTYWFAGTLPVSNPTASLTATVPDLTKGQVAIAFSTDGVSWTPAVVAKTKGSSTLSASAGKTGFTRIKSFRVRITLTGSPGSDTQPPVKIDNLKISAGL